MSDEAGLFDVEWDDGGRSLLGRRTLVALLGLAVVAAAFAYDYWLHPAEPLAFGWDVTRVDWLWLACMWVDLVFVAGVVLADPGRTWTFLARLRRRPAAFVAGAVVVGIVVVGTVGPPVLGQPEPSFAYGSQPPLFASVPAESVVQCHNAVGDRCFGSPKHPLGTDDAGKDVFTMVLLATRVEVQLLTITTTLIVPVATLAGTVSAYVGGGVDRAITTVAETVKTVPAILVYLTWRWIAGTDGSLIMLVLSFGLVNWASVAVVVRSRALNEVGKDYVMAAESAGADALEVVADHLVPNVSRTALSVAVYQLPLFVTVEATLSFLQVGSPPSYALGTPPTVESWGKMIGTNFGDLGMAWWPVLMPVAGLLVTILALNLLADGLQDVLDPRGGT